MKDLKSKIIWGTLGVIGLASLYLVIVLLFWAGNKSRIYPGVSVAGLSLAGKNKDQAQKFLKEKTDAYLSEKINLSSEQSELISASDLGINFDIEKTVSDAINCGAENPFILGKSREIPLSVVFDEKALLVAIGSQSKNLNTAVTSSIVKQENGDIKIDDGDFGRRVSYAETTYRIKNTASGMGSKVDVAVFEIPPTFVSSDLVAVLPEIQEKAQKPLSLSDGIEDYLVPTEAVVSWVQLSSQKQKLSEIFGGDNLFSAILTGKNQKRSIFSVSLVENYLVELSKKIDQRPVNAKLAISGGRAVILVPDKKGKAVKIAPSAQNIVAALDSGEINVDLSVEIKKAEVRSDNLAELGITELVSTGYSTFAGSPQNRIHNIRTGASKFNGALVRPGEAFSFNETLGPVDASSGYLPELVILENKTVPQFGGGMCQVSSTAFRAALNAGLPILERMYHAYPVQYYKPYGVDATVYLPSPDLVFRNDTGKYILIQTSISGTRLRFDFYGTKPDRTIKFAGNPDGAGAVFPVEDVDPGISEQESRGKGSFTATVYRFIYDAAGKLTKTNKFISKYDSPDKYPH